MNNCTVNIGQQNTRTPARGQLDPRIRRGSGSISISECNLDTGTSTISTQTRYLHRLDIYTLQISTLSRYLDSLTPLYLFYSLCRSIKFAVSAHVSDLPFIHSVCCFLFYINCMTDEDSMQKYAK